MASKLSPQQAGKKKMRVAMEFREKWKFFVNRSVPENFQWENFLGQVPTESLRTQDSENVYERWVQQIFDPVLPARSWEMPVERELPAKIGRFRKTLRPQFSDFSLEIESAIFCIYQNTADSISRLKYENCGRKVFRYTVLGIFSPLELRVNFGRP